MNYKVNSLSVGEAAELVDMMPSEVSVLLNRGFVTPDVHVSNGIGDPSMLGPRNIRELRLIAKLKKAGLKDDVVRSVLKVVNESSLNWWKEDKTYVALLKNRWVVTDNPFSEANRKLFFGEGIWLLIEV